MRYGGYRRLHCTAWQRPRVGGGIPSEGWHAYRLDLNFSYTEMQRVQLI